MRFRLTKWYFDAVSPQGQVGVVYRVRLVIGPCTFCVSALLRADAPGLLHETSALCTLGHLDEEPGQLVWRCPRLEFEGRWRAAASPVERTLIAGAGGSVVWRCLMPAADAEVAWRGERWTGRGYVECLDMTMAPWRLPIDELLWGRFVGPRSSIVWIRWRGEHPLTLVLDGGVEAAGAEIDDEGLGVPGRWDLRMEQPAVLRDGTLEEVSLRPLGKLARMIPRRIRATCETKWLAQAVLRRSDADTPERGWALHERVVLGEGRA